MFTGIRHRHLSGCVTASFVVAELRPFMMDRNRPTGDIRRSTFSAGKLTLIAEHIGPPHSMALCGLLSLVAAGLYLMQLPAIRREILPVYRQPGIVPDARARPGGTVKPGST